jgi:hypothetical protein
VSNCCPDDVFEVGDIPLVEILPRSEEWCQLCDEIGFGLRARSNVEVDHELLGWHVQPTDQCREPVGVGA